MLMRRIKLAFGVGSSEDRSMQTPVLHGNETARAAGAGIVDESMLEAKYAADFERRVAEMTELLRIEITKELRIQFTTEPQLGIETVRAMILDEIANTEQGLYETDRALEEVLADRTARLGTILELKAAKREMSAYLKGLSFAGNKSGIPLAPHTGDVSKGAGAFALCDADPVHAEILSAR